MKLSSTLSLGVICTFLMFLPSHLFGQLDFQSPSHLMGLRETTSLQTGDFDGDQLIDLAFTTVSDSRLHIMYKELNGSYSRIYSFITENLAPTTEFSPKITVGDFNNDGKKDVVLFNNQINSSKKIFVLLSNGRDFHESKVIEDMSTLQGLAIDAGDINSDGHQDFIIGFQDVSTVFHAYLGNGNGTFMKKIVANTSFCELIRLTDINTDGKLDLISANRFTPLLKVFLGDGTGDFTFKTNLQTTATPLDFIIEDFSGDNVPDVIVNTINTTSSDYFLGDGTGLFSKTLISTIDNFSPFLGLTSCDYNSDGRNDFIASGFRNGDYIMIFTNLGNNQFNQILLSNNSYSITNNLVTTDSDNDGKLEIISSTFSRVFTIRKQNSSGSFESINILPHGQLSSQGFDYDINGDSFKDLIVANELGNSIGVYLGNAQGVPVLKEFFTTNGNTTDIELKDINKDNFIDIVYCTQYGFGNSSEIGIIFLDGSGNSIMRSSYPISYGQSLVIEDFNEDDYYDLLTDHTLYLSNGASAFSYNFLNMPMAFDLQSGDFDNDGHLDFFATSTNEETTFYYGNGSGNFTPINFYLSTGGLNIHIKDLNKDNKLDIVTTNQNDNSISILKNNGNRNWEEIRITHESFNYVMSVASSDYNLDGIDDLAILNSHSSSVTILNGKNNFLYEFYKQYSVGNQPWSMIASDYNNDNRSDIITFEAGPSVLSILFNDNVSEPTLASSNLNFSNLQHSSVNVGITKGNGNGRIAIVREEQSTTAKPTDNFFYSSNSNFGIGAQVLVGQFAVFQGAGNNFSIANLKEDTNYFIELFEYSSNSKNTIINYLTNPSLTGSFKTKKSQAITFSQISDQEVGGPDLMLSASSSSTLPITYIVISGGAEINGGLLKTISPGPVTIKASQPGNENFSAAPDVTISFCINPGKPTISYLPSANEKFLLTSSSPTNNIWLKNSEVIPNQTDQSIEVEANGEYTVKVDYSSCSNTSLSIKSQTISFPDIPSKTEGQQDFQLSVSSDSGLPVTLNSGTGNLIITNNTISLGQPGPAAITATQTGNNSFFPAISVTRDFCINPKIPQINISFSTSGLFTLTSSSSVNNNWHLNGTPIPNATEVTHEPIQDGIYTVVVNYSGCSSTSLPTTNIITSSEQSSNQVSFYPNPVTNEVHLDKDSRLIITKITLVDSKGSIIEVPYDSTTNCIKLNSVASGVFTLHVHTIAGILVKKLVKL